MDLFSNFNVMNNLNKISRLVISRCVFIIFLCLCSGCHTSFYSQVKKNQKFSTRIYKKYLNEYDNVSMLSSIGNSSVIWYYSNGKINITDIKKAKIFSVREFSCDSILNIKDYKQECFNECLDAEGFESSFYDKKTDSLYHVYICLDIRNLMINGSDCPVAKELREHIIKYKLREF